MRRHSKNNNEPTVLILEALLAHTEGNSVEKIDLEFVRAELAQINLDFGGYDFDTNTKTISVITKPITLGDVELGRFKILLYLDHMESGIPSECFDIIALDPHPSAENPNITHPHVSGNRLCAGDATTPLSTALRDGRLCDFFIVVKSVLDTYNPDSPYVPLEDWVNYNLCYDCGSHIQPSETHFCPLCGEPFCRNCFGCISCCSLRICKICLTHMQYFDETECSTCLNRHDRISDIGAAISAKRLCAFELMLTSEPGATEYHLGRWGQINSDNDTKTLFLHWAARHGHVELAKLLIAKGEDVNAKDSSGQTPLHLASEYGHLEFVKTLVANECDVNAPDVDGYTALYAAAEYGQVAIVELLINNGATTDNVLKDGMTLLHIAALKGQPDMVKLFIKKGLKVSALTKQGYKPLDYAMSRGHLETIEILLRNGQECESAIRETLLYRTSRDGFVSLLEWLIDKKTNVNSQNERGKTPLFVACEHNHTECVQILLANGSDVNLADVNQRTALHQAALWNNKKIANLLLANGAAINARNKWGLTPLDLARHQDNSDMVKFLLSKGALQEDRRKRSRDQRIRKYAGGVVRLPDYAHGRDFKRTKPWQARIRFNGERPSLGTFATKKEAEAAYAKAVRRIDRGLPPKKPL